MDPHNCYFDHLIIDSEYLIIPFDRHNLRLVHIIQFLEPIIAHIQRSKWRESTFLWDSYELKLTQKNNWMQKMDTVNQPLQQWLSQYLGNGSCQIYVLPKMNSFENCCHLCPKSRINLLKYSINFHEIKVCPKNGSLFNLETELP